MVLKKKKEKKKVQAWNSKELESSSSSDGFWLCDYKLIMCKWTAPWYDGCVSLSPSPGLPEGWGRIWHEAICLKEKELFSGYLNLQKGQMSPAWPKEPKVGGQRDLEHATVYGLEQAPAPDRSIQCTLGPLSRHTREQGLWPKQQNKAKILCARVTTPLLCLGWPQLDMPAVPA